MPSPGPDGRGLEKYRRLTPLMAARVIAMHAFRNTAAAAHHCGCTPANIVRAVAIAERVLRVMLFQRNRNCREWILLPDRERIWNRINLMTDEDCGNP